MSNTIKIHHTETFWTHEWPGIRAVFFTQWCLMKCLYCHNPDTISIEWWKEYSFDELLKISLSTKPYFWAKWGVTFSGGECLLQAKELKEFFKILKENKIHTCIDTNGFILNEDVKELLEYTDLVLLDIKHMDEENHKKLTWVSNKQIFDFANYLKEINKPFWIRHVLVPGYTDSEEHLESLGKYFSSFANLERLEILPYHTLWIPKWKELWMKYGLAWVLPPTDEELLKAKSTLERNLKSVNIRK